MPEIAGQESFLGHRGEAWPMAARDPLERRADLLAATVQARVRLGTWPVGKEAVISRKRSQAHRGIR